MAKLRGEKAIGHITGVSPHNFASEIRADMDLPARVVMDDLTLREGRQLEGIVLSIDECVRIAHQLEELGVPMIQIANFAPEDYEVMKALGKLGLKMETETMTAAHQMPPFTREVVRKAIDQALECNLGVVLCLALSNDLLLATAKGRGQKDKSLSYLKKQEIEIGVEAVQYARNQGIAINVNLQDFLRCDWDHMEEFCRELAKAGVGVIILDDIAGPALPAVYKYGVRKAKKAAPNARLGIHVHNDYALALPAVLAAFEGGCEVLTCGINAYGERAGHADLASLAIDLEFLYGYDTGIHLEKLVETSTLISDIMRQALPKSAPIVGKNAFSHIHDWHWQFPEFPWAVASLAPEVVGNQTNATLGQWSGPCGIRMKGKELGIDIPWEKVDAVRTAFREEMRWKKRPLTDDEIRKAVAAVL